MEMEKVDNYKIFKIEMLVEFGDLFYRGKGKRQVKDDFYFCDL